MWEMEVTGLNQAIDSYDQERRTGLGGGVWGELIFYMNKTWIWILNTISCSADNNNGYCWLRKHIAN